jgi:hypothetical protein
VATPSSDAGPERDGPVEGPIDAGIVEGDDGHPPVGHLLQQQRLLQRALVEGIGDKPEPVPDKIRGLVVDRDARFPFLPQGAPSTIGCSQGLARPGQPSRDRQEH